MNVLKMFLYIVSVGKTNERRLKDMMSMQLGHSLKKVANWLDM